MSQKGKAAGAPPTKADLMPNIIYGDGHLTMRAWFTASTTDRARLAVMMI